MIEVNASIGQVNGPALDAALKAALASKVIGVSTYGAQRPVSIWLDDSAVQADIDQATTVANAHDPVFLSVDKTSIQANGIDAATVTVTAPKVAPANVTLVVNGVDLPISLSGGVGTDTITALDKTTITISVKNPANRSTDTITLQAV